MPKDLDPQSLTLHEVRRLLSRSLAKLEANVFAALSGPIDEQQVLQALDEQRGQLEDRVDMLRQALTELADIAPVDLNTVVSRALDEVLMDLEKPLALHVDWKPGLPSPSVPERALSSLLSRSITTIARHAASGDRLSFATATEGDEVVLSISLRPDRNGPGKVAQLDVLEAQCRPLHSQAHQLGGRFALISDQGLRLEFRLWAGPDRNGA